jgi:hypothetical protein
MLYWRFVLSVLRNAELSWYTKFVPDPYQNKFRGAMSSDWGSNRPIHQSGVKEVVMWGSSTLLKR